jgi:hypothetical protein
MAKEGKIGYRNNIKPKVEGREINTRQLIKKT